MVSNEILPHILYEEVELMSRAIRNFDSIRDVLKASIGRVVPIVLVGGRTILVEVVAVKGDLLLASVRCRIVTISIECICAVIINCETILRFLLKHRRIRETRERHEEDFTCGSRRRSRRRSRSRFRTTSISRIRTTSRLRTTSTSRFRSRSRFRGISGFTDLIGNLS